MKVKGQSAEDKRRTQGKDRVALAFLTLLVFCLTDSLPLLAGTRQDPPPRILIDQPLRAVEYQLGRLTNEELTRVERKDDDVRYRPVYFALLTRKGLTRQFKDEALAALTKLDKTTATAVVLEALARVPTDETVTAERLLAMLLGQSAETLRKQRSLFADAIEKGSPALVLRGAYGALLLADGASEPAWQVALPRDGHPIELLRSVAHLPAAATGETVLGDRLFTAIAAFASEAKDAGLRSEALMALPWIRHDARTFGILAREIVHGASDESRVAAVRALLRFPERAWPGDVEPVARAAVAWIGRTAPNLRTEPAMLDVIQLGERLAAGLPLETARGIRRELRSLAVQVVRIEAVPEQLLFDVKWFAVEAGKRVQIILSNPDVMPHNFVVSRPGSLQQVATLGGAMPQPSDPGVKPFVPDTPLVLHATRLLQVGETERLGFTAPASPGEYPYVCTFPGHWLRMYGVMLVVPDLEAWESKPTVPIDPMTGRPFTSKRN
jgi:azurin